MTTIANLLRMMLIKLMTKKVSLMNEQGISVESVDLQLAIRIRVHVGSYYPYRDVPECDGRDAPGAERPAFTSPQTSLALLKLTATLLQ